VKSCPLPGNFIRKLFELTGAISSSRMRKLLISTHSGAGRTAVQSVKCSRRFCQHCDFS
jgi:hypothetical protein